MNNFNVDESARRDSEHVFFRRRIEMISGMIKEKGNVNNKKKRRKRRITVKAEQDKWPWKGKGNRSRRKREGGG